MLKIGQPAPEFMAADQAGQNHQLSDYKGKWVLLYFYPRDNTPGCTTEACTLRDNYDDFKKIDAIILGVSTDSVKSHANFAGKYKLPFPILADADKKIIRAYGATGLISRISYLIDPQGNIAKVYSRVRPAQHAAEVLADLTLVKGSAKAA